MLLIALVVDRSEVQSQLSDVLQTDVLGAEEGGQAIVVGTSKVERDIAVEIPDGDLMKLLIHEADGFEMCGTDDLVNTDSQLTAAPLYAHVARVYLFYDRLFDLLGETAKLKLLFRHRLRGSGGGCGESMDGGCGRLSMAGLDLRGHVEWWRSECDQ